MRTHPTSTLAVNAKFLTEPMTGVQRFASEICLQLKAMRPDTIFLCPPQPVHVQLAQDLAAQPVGRLRGHAWEQVELPWHLARNNTPYLLNLANTAPILYPKNVITIHDLIYLRFPAWVSKKYYYFYKWMTPRIAARSKHILTVSAFSKQEITALLKVNERKVSVIHNAVSNRLVGKRSSAALADYGKYVLSVASLDPRKNLARLVEAFQQLPHQDLKLVVVGKKINSSFEIELNHDRIVHVENASDQELADLYKNAALFVYPSLYEGFGIPPLEAMANACPVVASSTSSLPEVLGDAAYYVDPTQSGSIREAIVTVLSNPALTKSLVERGKLQAKKYSWQHSATALVDVLKNHLNV